MSKDSTFVWFFRRIINLLEFGVPAADLLIRIWVFSVMWSFGLINIRLFDSIVQFEHIYAVPILPFEVAAYLVTAILLIFPILLVVGLGGRMAAGVLFLLYIFAIIWFSNLAIWEYSLYSQFSGDLTWMWYWFGPWGIMLLITVLRGPGIISIDHFIRKRLMN